MFPQHSNWIYSIESTVYSLHFFRWATYKYNKLLTESFEMMRRHCWHTKAQLLKSAIGNWQKIFCNISSVSWENLSTRSDCFLTCFEDFLRDDTPLFLRVPDALVGFAIVVTATTELRVEVSIKVGSINLDAFDAVWLLSPLLDSRVFSLPLTSETFFGEK